MCGGGGGGGNDKAQQRRHEEQMALQREQMAEQKRQFELQLRSKALRRAACSCNGTPAPALIRLQKLQRLCACGRRGSASHCSVPPPRNDLCR